LELKITTLFYILNHLLVMKVSDLLIRFRCEKDSFIY